MRIERLINLVLVLLRRDLVAARELAALFAVTERTVYRDVETLSLAGLPIYTLQGRNGGIGLLPNYKMAQNFLTASDVRNLLTALASVQALIETPALTATLQKLRSMAAGDEAAADLLIEDVNWQGAAEIKALAQQFAQAIKSKQVVTFQYSDRGGQLSQRQVEPYRLVYNGDRWYLQAFSYERQAFRTFRLARMQLVTVQAAHFTPRPLPIKQLALGRRPPEVLTLTPITLQAANQVRAVITERYGSAGIKQAVAGYFEVTLALPDNEAAYRFILSLGAQVKIIAGTAFRTHFKAYLAQITAQYQD
ncbi:helix-turn-helix transcriptional regulator [Loigolactobacillus binensis]|uniref:Helix-turn-helix transcriptional regulator n=1 Tax=Loigolactobacillus binensis TaxID=2559922 RepID=A0ABW3EBG1_9LACO|nr:YafY family protein [Loigolactobacillus binensis]